jgi:hypothetical protein
MSVQIKFMKFFAHEVELRRIVISYRVPLPRLEGEEFGAQAGQSSKEV